MTGRRDVKVMGLSDRCDDGGRKRGDEATVSPRSGSSGMTMIQIQNLIKYLVNTCYEHRCETRKEVLIQI